VARATDDARVGARTHAVDVNEPSVVATPMSMPFIYRTATTHDAAASPTVAVSTAAVAAVLALVRAFATSLFKSMVPSSFLHEFLQTTERFVPSLRDVLEVGSRYFHLFWLELPDALAATS